MNEHQNNGHTTGYLGRIDKLIAHHESIAAALRVTRDLLTNEARTVKQKRLDVISDALAIDAQRRSHKPGKRGPYKKHSPGSAGGRFSNRARTERRRDSLALLEQFSTTTPGRPDTTRGLRGIGSLVRRGYLAKRGKGKKAGYVRTSKEFVV